MRILLLALAFSACDSNFTEPENQSAPLNTVVFEPTPPVPNTPTGEQPSCSFRQRMETLMRHISLCWERDVQIETWVNYLCPVENMHRDLLPKFQTLISCYGLEVMVVDGHPFYRWPNIEAKNHAIEVVESLQRPYN